MEKEKNTCGKIRDRGNPYEVWISPDREWRWEVLKKYQAPHQEKMNPYARWFCNVYSPFVKNGEMGDVYISDIKDIAQKQ